MVVMPGQLFYSRRYSSASGSWPRTAGAKYRDRQGEVLSIDARRLGRMVDRTHRELTYVAR